MELWAAWAHRVLWHGPLWGLHRSHHAGERDIAPRQKSSLRILRALELNDIFAPLHAALAVWLCMSGLSRAPSLLGLLLTSAGFGMTLFGVLYWLLHDGLAHGRLLGKQRPGWAYLRRLRGAHNVHHRTGGAPYGFFLAPRWLRSKPREKASRSAKPSLPRVDLSD